jgi:nitrite reductase/ring-hydroxylating ferredoxin subunit
MVAFVRVASVRDVPPGKMMTVQVNDQPVVLANVDGTIYAFSRLCQVNSWAKKPFPLGGFFSAF